MGSHWWSDSIMVVPFTFYLAEVGRTVKQIILKPPTALTWLTQVHFFFFFSSVHHQFSDNHENFGSEVEKTFAKMSSPGAFHVDFRGYHTDREQWCTVVNGLSRTVFLRAYVCLCLSVCLFNLNSTNVKVRYCIWEVVKNAILSRFIDCFQWFVCLQLRMMNESKFWWISVWVIH